MKIRTESVNSFHRHRGNRRKRDWEKAHRKMELSKRFDWNEPVPGRLRKGKIHCSCFLCRSKTNHRKMWNGSDRRGDNWSTSDARKLDFMESQILDRLEEDN